MSLAHRMMMLGGGPAFTPKDIPNLVAWFDAGQTSGTNGANLTTWTDISGAGFDLNVQPAGVNVFHETGGSNNTPYVQFSLGPLQRAAPLVSGADAARTYYVVLQCTTEGHPAIFDGRNGFNGFGITYGANALHKREILVGGVQYDTDTTSNLTANWEYTGFINVGGATQRLRVNGSEHTLSGSAATLASTTAFSVGGNDQGFAPDSFIGNIAEFVGYSGVVSAGDITKLETYFANKYGI